MVVAAVRWISLFKCCRQRCRLFFLATQSNLRRHWDDNGRSRTTGWWRQRLAQETGGQPVAEGQEKQRACAPPVDLSETSNLPFSLVTNAVNTCLTHPRVHVFLPLPPTLLSSATSFLHISQVLPASDGTTTNGSMIDDDDDSQKNPNFFFFNNDLCLG